MFEQRNLIHPHVVGTTDLMTGTLEQQFYAAAVTNEHEVDITVETYWDCAPDGSMFLAVNIITDPDEAEVRTRVQVNDETVHQNFEMPKSESEEEVREE